MKFVLKIFKSVKPNFEEGGKFKTFLPLYEAMENFCFAPSTTTQLAPFARDPLDVKRFMTMVIIALVPALAMSYYFFGARLIAMIIVSYAAGGMVEVLFACVRKEPIAEGFLVTGMLFPMILPPTLPLPILAIGVIFGVLIGKELFGGTGRNVFNPAIVGRCFLALAYPKAMSGNFTTAGTEIPGRMLEYIHAGNAAAHDAISTATPLVLAKQGEMVNTVDMLIGNTSGSISETSAIAIILGGVFLLLTRIANWRTVVSILAAAFVTAAVIYNTDTTRFAPPMWHMCAGGLLFGAFFMATDPVSSPITNAGKRIYGIMIGVVTMLIRNFTGYVEGVMFAILLGNIVAPILDEIVFKIRIGRLKSER